MTKVLIIRFSSIGDIVLCTPVIRCIKDQLGAEIHFLTKKRFSGLLSANPKIDQIISYEDIENDLNALVSNEYDYIIDLHNNLRSKKVCRSLGKETFTLDKINIPKWLKVNLGVNRLPSKHIVSRKFDAIKGLKVHYDGTGLDFYFEEEAGLLSDYPKSKNRIGIVLGAAHFTKRIPRELIADIIVNNDAEFFLLGGPAEFEQGDILAKEFNVVNWCGKASLHGSAQLIDSCDLIISADTGLMHISAALNKKIIAIWGSTIPEFGMYPFMKADGQVFYNAEVEDLHCRPCSKIGYKYCPKGHFACMKNQDLKDINKQIKDLLSK